MLTVRALADKRSNHLRGQSKMLLYVDNVPLYTHKICFISI